MAGASAARAAVPRDVPAAFRRHPAGDGPVRGGVSPAGGAGEMRSRGPEPRHAGRLDGQHPDHREGHHLLAGARGRLRLGDPRGLGGLLHHDRRRRGRHGPRDPVRRVPSGGASGRGRRGEEGDGDPDPEGGERRRRLDSIPGGEPGEKRGPGRGGGPAQPGLQREGGAEGRPHRPDCSRRGDAPELPRREGGPALRREDGHAPSLRREGEKGGHVRGGSASFPGSPIPTS